MKLVNRKRNSAGLADRLPRFKQPVKGNDRRINVPVRRQRHAAVSHGERGIVLVDAEMEQSPAYGGAPLLKRDQLRFEIGYGRNGWRVVDVRDRRFFS